MKGLVVGVAAVVMAPVVTLGLLVGTFASNSLDDRCPPVATPATDSVGACGAAGDEGPATAFHGSDGYVDDPTSSGRITRRMLHTYDEVQRVFNGWAWGVGCWDPHLWNPTSDHPRGLACDFSVGRIGQFPTAAQRAIGWQLAHWAQANADTLGISYIIWDGRIWSPSRAHQGWRSYGGGGIYDATSATGGHFDHVHVSVVPLRP